MSKILLDNGKTLYRRQLGIMLFLVPMIFKIGMLPSLISKIMAQDAWIGALLLVSIDLVELLLIIGVANLGGISKIKGKMPKWAYCFLVTPLIIIFCAKSIVNLGELVNYITAYLFYNITNIEIIVVLLVVVGYVALKGARAMGRLAEIILWLVPMIFVVGFIFGQAEFRVDYIFPILPDGLGDAGVAIDKYMMWSLCFTPFLFLNVEPPKPKKPILLISGMLGSVGVVAIFAFFIMNYGGSAELMDNAFARLAAFNVVSTEIGAIDWPTISLWMIMGIIILSVYSYATAEIMSEWKASRRLTIPTYLAIVGIIVAFVTSNIERTINFALSGFRYIVVLEFFIVLCLFLVSRFGKTPKPSTQPKKSAQRSNNG